MNRLTTFLFLFILGCVSCTDNAITDTNQEFPNRNWSYVNKLSFPVTITDPGKDYALLLNLRHTADYKYANIFVLFHVSGPGIKRSTTRKEYRLAYPDGQWLGSGSGNLFSYQLPLDTAYRFPSKGRYIIEVEQNMRDNPLREVSDAGLRLEPSR